MFLKLSIFLLISSFAVFSSSFTSISSFNGKDIVKDYNVIIVIQQQSANIESQLVLLSILNKLPNETSSETFQELMHSLINQQKFISTYRHKNELLQPIFNSIHQYQRFSLRFNKYSLNSERRIISNAFKALDEFVINERNYRPICLIIDFPAIQNFNLNRLALNDTGTFESRRDFSLINLYHEIHSRRYLFPSKVILFSTLDSYPIIINNF